MGAIALIRKSEASRRKDAHNGTRIYNYVVALKGGECRIDTYAVKTRSMRTGELAIKKVAAYYSADRRCRLRDIIRNNFTHALCVNWANEPFGRRHQAVWQDVDAYIGVWGDDDATFRHCIDLHGEYLNGFEGTRYAKCGYSTDSGYKMHFMQYIECWNIDHAVEFLAKAGMWQLIRPSFIRRLSKDADFKRFFRSHIADIRDSAGGYWGGVRYGVGAIERAYRSGESLAEASAYLSFLGETTRLNDIPKSVDRKSLFRYLRKNGIDSYAYNRYCSMLARLDIDIGTYGYMFPTEWTRKYDKVDDAHRALLERERIAREKEEKRRLAEERREARRRLAHWKMICGYVDESVVGKLYGGYAVAVLRDKRDLIAEGNAMHNCIGDYGQSVKEGRALLLSLRQDGKPVYDVEIDPESMRVVQARKKDNKNAPRQIHALVRSIASDIKASVGKMEAKGKSKARRRAA